MIINKVIEENYEYLDRVAIENMKVLLAVRPPQGFSDSMSISRVSYKQALAMLEVRETSLISLAEESGIIKKGKDEG